MAFYQNEDYEISIRNAQKVVDERKRRKLSMRVPLDALAFAERAFEDFKNQNLRIERKKLEKNNQERNKTFREKLGERFKIFKIE